MSEGDCLQDTQCWVHTELALTKEFMCHLKGFLHWSMTPFMFPTIGKPLPAGNAETVMNPEAKEFQVFSSSHSGPKRQQRMSSWQKINTTSMWTKHCFLLSRNRGLYPWVEYYTLQTILTGDLSLGMQRNISEAKKEITTIRALCLQRPQLQRAANYSNLWSWFIFLC